MRMIGLFALICLASVICAEAQTNFGELPIRPGDFVYATDANGVEVSGSLTSLSPMSLSIGDYSFKPEPGLKIERRGDPIWDGAATGAAIGIGVGTLMSTGECGVDWHAWQCALSGGMWGALLGTLIDYQHKGRTTVFLGTASAAGPARVPRPPAGRPASVSVRFSF
jgi:hypothetical protein